MFIDQFMERACFLLAVVSCLLPTTKGFSGSAPMSVAQLAIYQGGDREKLLVEGAKREGQFTLYTSHTWFRTLVKDFEKKYPFTKVSEWRNDSKNIIRKVLEESKSGRVLVDVVETTADGMGIIKQEGLLLEYYSPQARYYPDELKPKGKNGFFYLPDRETYNSLGFNTTLVPPATAPRNFKDLLDPKWKGKMAITSTTTGVRWIGNVLDVMGREYLNKMADQEVCVQDMASGLNEFGCLRRGSAIADDLRCQCHHREAEGSVRRMASVRACGYNRWFFRAHG